MKTKSIALILAAISLLLLAIFFKQASGKSETSDDRPAISKSKAEGVPVMHVGMGENQPL